jgi:hypothetical protein
MFKAKGNPEENHTSFYSIAKITCAKQSSSHVIMGRINVKKGYKCSEFSLSPSENLKRNQRRETCMYLLKD